MQSHDLVRKLMYVDMSHVPPGFDFETLNRPDLVFSYGSAHVKFMDGFLVWNPLTSDDPDCDEENISLLRESPDIAWMEPVLKLAQERECRFILFLDDSGHCGQDDLPVYRD